MKNNMNKYKAAQTAIKVLPFAALVLLFGIFLAVVSAKGYRLDMYLQIVFNEGVVLAVVATGAIFIYTLGTLISVLALQPCFLQPWVWLLTILHRM